jgi:hypothetical protein
MKQAEIANKIGSDYCGWHGTLGTYRQLEKTSFLQGLQQWHQLSLNETARSSQVVAWQESYEIIQAVLGSILLNHPAAIVWGIIFEYELPRERGRRPDVLILAGDQLIILEFKGYGEIRTAHLDQVAAYARDLKYYHEKSRGLRIYPVLVLTKAILQREKKNNVHVTSPDQLAERLAAILKSAAAPAVQLTEWINSAYLPLPSLVDAARTLFQRKPLPQLRRANSAGIPAALTELRNVAKTAKQNKEHHLALITGVPGAGKTLAGLQFVYEYSDETGSAIPDAVFLSGNGPLVKVLQHALGDERIFVQGVHDFLRQYGGNRQQAPHEHVWIYDEAQRAWDAEQVLKKRGHHRSEPADFLTLATRKSWALMVGLIGEGQEIYLGEEAGLTQWNAAIAQSGCSWTVHCPEKIAAVFAAAAETQSEERFNLTASLRSHLAEDVQVWISQVLAGEIDAAAASAKKVANQHFDLYVTQELNAAKHYVQSRYEGQTEKRYGLLASSRARNLSRFGVPNRYQDTIDMAVGAWYNDPLTSPKSCCQLRSVATEFDCQGLELDFPIVCWGDDVFWDGWIWKSTNGAINGVKDPHRLRINSYRVLLSRGRDGMLIFVPAEGKMQPTLEILVKMGLKLLER